MISSRLSLRSGERMPWEGVAVAMYRVYLPASWRKPVRPGRPLRSLPHAGTERPRGFAAPRRRDGRRAARARGDDPGLAPARAARLVLRRGLGDVGAVLAGARGQALPP